MRRITGFALVGTALAQTAGIAIAAQASILPPRIIQAAQERVEARWYPTVVIASVDGGKTEIATFGRLDNGKLPNQRTVYEIGSITKTFTGALLGKAIQSGRVKPDTPVTDLLPGFKIPSRGGKQITLVDLATQSSGLPYMPDNLAPADAANPFADYDAAKLKAFLTSYQLKRDPGKSYEYSNLGFGLIGFAITQPQSYAQVLRTEIFRPLGMKMSDVGLTGSMTSHLATGHNRRNQDTENWRFDVLAGCGGIDSTAADMLRYLKANMMTGRTTFSSTFQTGQNPRREMDETDRIGLAWMTREAQPQDVIWHDGTTFGYASFIGFTADRKRGIVILTNISESVDDLGFAALSNAPLRSYKTIPVARGELESLAGVYKTSDGGLVKILLRNGQAYAEARGEDEIPLFPQSHDEFFTRIEGFHLIFRRDEAGRIASVILRQQSDRVAARLSGDEAVAALQEFRKPTR